MHNDLLISLAHRFVFEIFTAFIENPHEYIYYYNNERRSRKLKEMSSVQYRAHSQAI